MFKLSLMSGCKKILQNQEIHLKLYQKANLLLDTLKTKEYTLINKAYICLNYCYPIGFAYKEWTSFIV